jgi:CRISPR type III-B/RAMP module RAMP protein Cmr6
MLSRAPFPVRAFQAKTLWYLHLCKSSSELIGKVVGLDRNFPVPIIRGSAVKGTTRKYAEQYLLPENRLSQEEFEELFGGSPQEPAPNPGNLIFFNAVPLSSNYLRVDARTNQHDGYYSGDENRMARNNVVPIFFFSVPSGVPYLFAIGSERTETLDRGVEILKQALRKGGLGAKTHVGYGYFEALP